MTAKRQAANGEGSVFPSGCGSCPKCKRDTDGRWVKSCRWTATWFEFNKRPKKSAPTRAAAKAILRDALARVSEGKPGLDSTMTFGDYSKHWRTEVLPHARNRQGRPLARGTITTYSDVMRSQVEPVLGPKQMGAITEADVERVIAEMVSKGHSGSYQHQAHKSMARLFRDARKARLIAVVPMQDVPAPAEIPTKEIVVPTTAEVAALIATAPDPRVRAFIATLAYTGARSFEVLNVRWSDYDVEAGLMTVTRKGGKLDTIPVVPTLATELAAWRKVQAAEQLAAHWWDDGGWMLSSDCGTHWDKRNARRRFTAVAEKVCPGATPHSMRHAAGTTLLEAGVAPLVVSKLLGHADTRITEKTYQKVRPALAGEGAAALERAIANG